MPEQPSQQTSSPVNKELRRPPIGVDAPTEYSKHEWVITKPGGDIVHGVPDEGVASQVRDELLELLDEKGIDPSRVLFSGYSGVGHDKDRDFDVEEQIGKQIQTLSTEANKLYAQGTFDDDPELRDQYTAKIQALKDKKGALAAGTAQYFFNNVDGLSETYVAMNNPIHYAGISTEATIGVYDPARLHVDDDSSATLTPEAVDAALLLQFHPRYVDSHGDPFES